MRRTAWLTSLLPLALPVVSLVAAIALASRWSAPDQIQASIVERWTLIALLAIPPALITGLYTVQPQLGYDLAVDVQRTGYPGQLWAYVYEHWGVDPGLLFLSLVRPDASTPLSLVVWCAIALGLVVLGAVLRPALRPAAAPGSSPRESAEVRLTGTTYSSRSGYVIGGARHSPPQLAALHDRQGRACF